MICYLMRLFVHIIRATTFLMIKKTQENKTTDSHDTPDDIDDIFSYNNVYSDMKRCFLLAFSSSVTISSPVAMSSTLSCWTNLRRQRVNGPDGGAGRGAGGAGRTGAGTGNEDIGCCWFCLFLVSIIILLANQILGFMRGEMKKK